MLVCGVPYAFYMRAFSLVLSLLVFDPAAVSPLWVFADWRRNSLIGERAIVGTF